MINTVIEIAKGVGEILMKYHRKSFSVSTKRGPFDFVSTADIEADEFLRTALAKSFPNTQILSEENPTEVKDFTGDVWIVDPLDGTKAFVNHGDGFSVMIGLCKNGKPHLGVVYGPAKDVLYYAVKGRGSYVKDGGSVSKMKVSTVDSLHQSRLVTRIAFGENKRPSESLINSLVVKERIAESSIGLKVGLIARGNADIHVNTSLNSCKWDSCAPQVILEEAGGLLTDFKGKPLNYCQPNVQWGVPFIASNGTQLHQELIDALNCGRN